jgi:ribosomal protein L5
MLVGCKVTLRRKNLNEFFDSLALAVPRMEKFKTISSKKIKKNKSNMFSISILEQMEIHFLFNILTIEEKIFLLRTKHIPIEI